MATSTTELILKFSGDPRNLKETLAQVRGDLSNLGKAQVSVARESNKQVATEAKNQTKTLEQEERARLRSAESLQRQRSAALIAAWKAEAREKARIDKETADASAKASQLFSLEGLTGNIPVLKNFSSQFSALSTEGAAASSVLVGVAGAIGIMVAGATIGIAVLAKLGSEIFDLSKKTAEFQGKFFDLSQQVGVSVETLSTLDVIASTTGGNIDTVTASLAIFQKHLETSHDPTSKEAKLLKDLGVTTLDTETALRQAIKGLFNLGEGSKQTDAALQLFGRSGRFVNAIMKESKGNFDEAAKAIGGLQISREAAAAADQFNDSLNILNRTLARVSANIVSEAIPVFTVFFQDLNKGITGNEDDWSFWADLIKTEVAGVLGTLQGFILFVKSGFNIDLGTAIDSSIRSLLDRSDQLRNKLRFESDVEGILRKTQAILAGKPGDTPNADKANSEAQARAAKSISNQQAALEESTREHRVALERERDKDLRSIDQWEEESIAAASAHLSAQQAIFDEESQNINKFIKGREEGLLAQTALEIKRTQAANQTREQIQNIQDEANKRREQSELNLNQQLLKIRDAQRDEEQQEIKADLDRGIVLESGAIQRQLALLKQAFDDREVLRNQELQQATTSAARQVQLTNERLEAEIRYTTEFGRLTKERIDAMVREGAAATPAPGGRVPELNPAKVFDVDAIGIPPPPDLSLWEDAISHLKLMLEDFSVFATGTVKFAISSLADGLADAARAWVLYGDSIGKALKRALAETLASIAAQALIQAALHAAYAIGSLAFGNFAAAAQHGIAALKFGAVAAIAGLAGRAIAGNSFSGAGSSGTASSESPNNNRASSTATQPKPVNIDRATLNQQAIVVHLNITRDEGSTVKAVVENYNGNGEIRGLIMNEIRR